METVYETVGKRLREARLALGYTQKLLAEKAGISVAFLSFIETGHRKGSLQTYADLAAALGLGLEELFKPAKPKAAYKDPRPSLEGLSVAESQAVEHLVKTLRRKR